MTSPIALNLQAGDHVCGFYYGDEERDAMLLPFLRDGLLAGTSASPWSTPPPRRP